MIGIDIAVGGFLIATIGAGFPVFVYFDKQRLQLERRLSTLEFKCEDNHSHIVELENGMSKRLDKLEGKIDRLIEMLMEAKK